MSLNVLFVNQSKVRMPKAFLAKWVLACEKELNQKLPAKLKNKLTGEMTLVFMDVKEAKKLNRDYRERDYATDVLSFAGPDSFGDLVMCPQVLQKQAKEHGLTFQQELGYMVLHGMLHLLGYDHELGEKEARRMFSLQDSIFEKLTE